MPTIPVRMQPWILATTTQAAHTKHSITVPLNLNTTAVAMMLVPTERLTPAQKNTPASNIRTLMYLLSPIPTLVSTTPISMEPTSPSSTPTSTNMMCPLRYPQMMIFPIVITTPEYIDLILQLRQQHQLLRYALWYDHQT